MSTSRSLILAFALVLTLPATILAQSPGNVLVIIADDMGVDKLASYGVGTQVPNTPVLDAMASHGLRFSSCWAMPLCSPTRAAFLTGRYPFRNGVGNALPPFNDLADEEVTLPEALSLAAAAGAPARAKGMFGKWHLGGADTAPTDQGFDHFAGILAGGTPDYYNWPRTENGVTRIDHTYMTTRIVDDALNWIGQQALPWFCYVAFTAPHTPFHEPPAHLHTQNLPNLDPNRFPVPFYNAMTEAMDTEIGRMLQSLPAGQLENTTVIFIGDNGTTGDVVLPPFDPTRPKGTLFQGGVHVPLIITRPGMPTAGATCDRIVDVSDLFPTVFELLGHDPQTLHALTGGAIDGRSLVPYLQDAGAPASRSWVFTQEFGNIGTTTPESRLTVPLPIIGGAVAQDGQAIRDDRFKLIELEDGSELFFDLVADPLELDELIGSNRLTLFQRRRLADLRRTMDQLLDGWKVGR